MKRFAALVLLIGVLGGCAVMPQQVNLSPTLTVLSSVEGTSITVAVRVVDDRRLKTLGRIVGGSGGSAEVTSQEEVAAVVGKCLVEGLKKKGFNPVDFEEGINPRLTVEVHLFEYAAFKGFPTGRAIIKGALKAVAIRGKTTFESNYRAEREEKILSLPTAEKTEKWINSVLGEVVSQLLSDTSLLKFLAT
jgi:uncharacterized lipoprotein